VEVEQDQKTAVVQHKMDQEIQVVLEVEREDLLFLQEVQVFVVKVMQEEVTVIQRAQITEVVEVVVELVRQELMVMMLVAQ
jgi:urease accessory protein UreE